MKTFLTMLIGSFACHTFADTYVVIANSSSWSPDVVNVVPGDIVRFEYGTGYPHTATSGSPCMADDLFDGALNGPGDYLEWTVPADAPAEVPFFCLPHCTFGMTGMINVELPQGSMHIGIVTITNPTTMTYTLNSDETGTISIEGAAINSSSFALGVEIEENDVDAEITVVVAGH